jgi:hypothetical protein
MGASVSTNVKKNISHRLTTKGKRCSREHSERELVLARHSVCSLESGTVASKVLRTSVPNRKNIRCHNPPSSFSMPIVKSCFLFLKSWPPPWLLEFTADGNFSCVKIKKIPLSNPYKLVGQPLSAVCDGLFSIFLLTLWICSLPISWDQPTSTTAHNIHQFCDRVVPPEDGQVMPETCRDIEYQ